MMMGHKAFVSWWLTRWLRRWVGGWVCVCVVGAYSTVAITLPPVCVNARGLYTLKIKNEPNHLLISVLDFWGLCARVGATSMGTQFDWGLCMSGCYSTSMGCGIEVRRKLESSLLRVGSRNCDLANGLFC